MGQGAAGDGAEGQLDAARMIYQDPLSYLVIAKGGCLSTAECRGLRNYEPRTA